jgi:hypothetical protein
MSILISVPQPFALFVTRYSEDAVGFLSALFIEASPRQWTLHETLQMRSLRHDHAAELRLHGNYESAEEAIRA